MNCHGTEDVQQLSLASGDPQDQGTYLQPTSIKIKNFNAYSSSEVEKNIKTDKRTWVRSCEKHLKHLGLDTYRKSNLPIYRKILKYHCNSI